MANQGFWQDSDAWLSADNLNAMFLQYGAFASRPSHGQRGRQWFDTTTGLEYYDTGSGWEIKPNHGISMIRFQNTSSAITASLSSPVIITCNNVNSSGAMVRASSGELHLLVTENVAANADGYGWLKGVISGLTVPSTLNNGDSIWIDTDNSVFSSGINKDSVYAGKLLNKTSKLVLYDYNKSIHSRIDISRDSSKDFTLISNTSPYDIWSDGTTMWVLDRRYNAILAYNMSTKARDSSKDFNTLTAALNTNAYGLWSDGTTMWVTDNFYNKLYAYNLSTKARDSGKDFNTLSAAGNTSPTGIWSDGTTMWVLDNADDKLYAYNMSTKARDNIKDFNTSIATGNTSPINLWSDGTTMWVSNHNTTNMYAYNLSSKARDIGKDFNTIRVASGSNNPHGLWSDGTTMWVPDNTDNKIYAYNLYSVTVG